MYFIYRAVTSLVSPLVPWLLNRRMARGKEDPARLGERSGIASLPRPAGKLVWIHGASVGEANAIVPLIEELLQQHAGLHVLLTTVTVTSALLMAKRLPTRALHQFAPVDTPAAVETFLAHWRPDVALWVDSEFWPNLICRTRKTGAVMGIVNARMSERSFRRWRYAASFMRAMLSGFTLCFAQSAADGERLLKLGIPAITRIGNLKYETPPLPFNAAELARLRAETRGRAVWVAASTHPGEEAMIADVHRLLAAQGIDPLTIIVPRHAMRGGEVAKALSPLKVACRSLGETITPETAIYLADTMGELGLFYRLAPIAFMGGTLVPHGGQNLLEPAKLGPAVIVGPHMENFAGIMAAMQRENAVLKVADAGELARQLGRLFGDAGARAKLVANAQAHVASHQGIQTVIIQQLQRYLA